MIPEIVPIITFLLEAVPIIINFEVLKGQLGGLQAINPSNASPPLNLPPTLLFPSFSLQAFRTLKQQRRNKQHKVNKLGPQGCHMH